MSKKKKPEKSLIAEAIYAVTAKKLARLSGLFVTYKVIKTMTETGKKRKGITIDK